MPDEIRIQFTRFSAFYTPLIATIAGGFLKEEGFAPKDSVRSAIEGLIDGSVHVCQSAPSQAFGPLAKGQRPPAVHFAQINEKDGFFLTGQPALKNGRRILNELNELLAKWGADALCVSGKRYLPSRFRAALRTLFTSARGPLRMKSRSVAVTSSEELNDGRVRGAEPWRPMTSP